MLWYILAALFLYVFYKLWKLKNFWKDRNIPSRETAWLFGDTMDNILRRKTFIQTIGDAYNEFPNSRYVGFHQITTPILIIREPELIKQVCIKDFDHFPEHQSFGTAAEIDPLWNKNLFASKAAKWKELRPLLSPTFTSSKMKLMFNLMDESAIRFVQYFKNQNESAVEVELKDTSSRFTNDVIATTAFGIECDSLKNRTNEFFVMGKSITSAFTGLRNLLFFAFNLFPNLMKMLGFTVFPKKAAGFFVNVIDTTIKEREQKKIIRPDLMNLLLEARKSGSTLRHDEQNDMTETGFATVEESSFGKDESYRKKALSDDDIYAQCLIFFFAGFDTVSNAMTLTLYELALNTDVQDKLRNEIDETWKDCKGKLNYEAITRMKYMDMVVSESLRKWTPAVFTDRRCVKRYVIPAVHPNETPVEIEPGQLVGIPLHGIHMDAKYFPEPQKFDPERFSDENKHNITPGTYNPFGVGPRNCIGSRFALLEMKTLIFHILRNFEITPNKKTQIPLVPSKSNFSFVGENGTWVDFVVRHTD